MQYVIECGLALSPHEDLTLTTLLEINAEQFAKLKFNVDLLILDECGAEVVRW